MRGLIIKDLLSLKNNWKQLVILFVGCLLLSIAMGNYLLCIIVVPVILSSSGITTFSTDEFYNTESFTLAMPLSRKEIVLSKYIFTLLMIVISLFVGELIYAFIDLFIKPGYYGLNTYMLYQLLMLECSSIIVDFIFYPIIYKYGCEKSRLVLMAIVMVFLGIISILSVSFNIFDTKLIDFEKVLDIFREYGLIILGFLTVVVSIISYYLSNLFYRHKDY